MHVTVERKHDGFVTQVPSKLDKHFERYQIYAWPEKSRFPISLGVVILPTNTDIKALEELLNAGV